MSKIIDLNAKIVMAERLKGRVLLYFYDTIIYQNRIQVRSAKWPLVIFSHFPSETNIGMEIETNLFPSQSN